MLWTITLKLSMNREIAAPRPTNHERWPLSVGDPRIQTTTRFYTLNRRMQSHNREKEGNCWVSGVDGGLGVLFGFRPCYTRSATRSPDRPSLLYM